MSSLTITPQSLTTTPSHLEIALSITNPPSATAAVSEGNPIAPATYLQLSFDFGNDMVVFPEEAMFTARDVVSSGRRDGQMMIRMERLGVPRSGNVNPKVELYAWKGEKVLGSWEVGRLGGQSQVVVR